jgi:hypothetical protein
MILWTIQHLNVYNILKEKGIYKPERKYTMAYNNIDISQAYEWMKYSMYLLCKSSINMDDEIIWAWYQWEGKRKPRDMRKSGYCTKGLPIVQLKIDIPDDNVLLSDFDLWHYVLNGWLIPENEYEKEEYDIDTMIMLQEQKRMIEEKRPCSIDYIKMSFQWEKRIQKSWDIIFNIDDNKIYALNGCQNKTIQATFSELKYNQILSVKHYISK